MHAADRLVGRSRQTELDTTVAFATTSFDVGAPTGNSGAGDRQSANVALSGRPNFNGVFERPCRLPGPLAAGRLWLAWLPTMPYAAQALIWARVAAILDHHHGNGTEIS